MPLKNDKLVVIGVPTYKRPNGLARLLDSLKALDADGIKVQIVVADNEGDGGAGLAVVARLKADYRFSIVGIGVPSQGISNVRNALMAVAFDRFGAQFLAMIDDDETVDSQWLHAFLDVQKLTNADVVGGAVYPDFSVVPPPWVNNCNLYWRPVSEEGVVPLLHGTTSVLISSTIWTRFGRPLFDVNFGLTGGGDKEYFTRLKSMGAVFAFAPKSISYEFFDESRLTLAWVKERSYRIGSAEMRIRKRYGIWWAEVIKALAGFVVFAFLWALLRPIKSKALWVNQKLWRQQGKLNGFFGRPPEVYKKVRGN